MEALEERGHAAIGARDGSDALQLLAIAKPLPCTILLDLMMPNMDGTAFRAEQCKSPAWSRIPVIVMSAFHDVAARASSLGVSHLTKPLRVEDLMNALAKLCQEPLSGRTAAAPAVAWLLASAVPELWQCVNAASTIRPQDLSLDGVHHVPIASRIESTTPINLSAPADDRGDVHLRAIG